MAVCPEYGGKLMIAVQAAPIGQSQLAPPKTITMPGDFSLTRLANARLGKFCMNVVVKPTASGAAATISVAMASTKSPASAPHLRGHADIRAVFGCEAPQFRVPITGIPIQGTGENPAARTQRNAIVRDVLVMPRGHPPAGRDEQVLRPADVAKCSVTATCGWLRASVPRTRARPVLAIVIILPPDRQSVGAPRSSRRATGSPVTAPPSAVAHGKSTMK